MPKEDVPLVELARPEWVFDDCPEDEVLDCWRYEFAREVDWLRAAVERRRGPLTSKYGATVQVDTLTSFARGTFYTFLLVPQWPDNPYLSIDKKERQKWISWTRLQTEQELYADFLIPERLPNGMEASFRESLEDLGRPRIRSKTQRIELAALRIDWGVPDTILRKCFDSYLKQFRPTVIQPKNHAAKKTPSFVRRQQLQQLGMFRIIRANGGSVSRAREAEKRLQIEKLDPWYKARKVVSDIIQNAETKIVPKLSREELERM